MRLRFCHLIWLVFSLVLSSNLARPALAQERIRVSYSSADTSNAVYFVADAQGLYKKYGLDVESIFIPSTTTSVTSLLAGDVRVANATGGGIASAVVGGANLVMVACYINTLPYELVVQESVKSPQDLKGKSVGISRVGSASDTAAQVLLRGLGLEPVKDVPIIQVGGAGERAAAFRTGRIVGFPSPPGVVQLTQGMPHKILITTADLKQRFEFPYICANTMKTYLASQREAVKRIAMALTEAGYFIKTRKEESKKIIAKYTRQNNEAYLESSYSVVVKLIERTPYVTRAGTDIQIKEALARKPGATLRFEDMVDESIVRELEKSGFIDQLYKK